MPQVSLGPTAPPAVKQVHPPGQKSLMLANGHYAPKHGRMTPYEFLRQPPPVTGAPMSYSNPQGFSPLFGYNGYQKGGLYKAEYGDKAVDIHYGAMASGDVRWVHQKAERLTPAPKTEPVIPSGMLPAAPRIISYVQHPDRIAYAVKLAEAQGRWNPFNQGQVGKAPLQW